MGFRDRLRKFWMDFRNDPRTKPALADVKCKAGCQLFETGDYENALVLFKEAIQHNPCHVEAYLGLGEAHYGLRSYAEGRHAYGKVVHFQPDHAQAHFKLGLIHIVFGDNRLAKAEYYVLLRLDRPLADQLYQAIPRKAWIPSPSETDLTFKGDKRRQSTWRRGKGLEFPRVEVFPGRVLWDGPEEWFQFLMQCSDMEVEDLLIALDKLAQS